MGFEFLAVDRIEGLARMAGNLQLGLPQAKPIVPGGLAGPPVAPQAPPQQVALPQGGNIPPEMIIAALVAGLPKKEEVTG